MYQTIFEPGKELSDEELGKRVRHFRTKIRLVQKLDHKSIQANTNTMTLFFGDFPYQVYCNVTAVSLEITQQALGGGSSLLSLTQNCHSRFDTNLGVDWDWYWIVYLYNAAGALLASFNVGNLFHECGDHAIAIPSNWNYPNAPDIITNTAKATLVWTYQETVLPC